MFSEILLDTLKMNLSLATTAYDDYLIELIKASRQMIKREGIKIRCTAEDAQLIVMYAAYLFRKRAEDNPIMPRMLRYALNNRLFSQKIQEWDR